MTINTNTVSIIGTENVPGYRVTVVTPEGKQSEKFFPVGKFTDYNVDAAYKAACEYADRMKYPKQVLKVTKLVKNYRVVSLTEQVHPQACVSPRMTPGEKVDAQVIGILCQPGVARYLEIWVDGKHINPEWD